MIGEDDRSHVFGLSFIDIVAPTDRKRIAALLDRVREGESTQADFGALIDKERRVFSASFLPLHSPDGNVQKLRVSCRTSPTHICWPTNCLIERVTMH